jgi:uncharacterized membrane protein SpoIIM required for sporulation
VIEQFVADRRDEWRRLEALLDRARGGPGRLSADEVEELGRLYRRSTSDLAIARRDFAGDAVARYLEQLVGRGHPVVYRRPRGSAAGIWRFLSRGFPDAFRRNARYTLAAFLLVAGPFALAFVATTLDPVNGRVLVSARPFVEQVERGESWLTVPEQARPLMASFVWLNNVQVAFLAFAGGVLFGLGTAYVLIANGLSLGAVAGLAGSYGLGPTLAGFVAAHSGLELTVVFTAGGAGLAIGHALLDPGLLPRRAALAGAARRGIRLVAGCVPLLALAGALEGLVSPSDLPPTLKLAIGAAATLGLYAYLLKAGRGPPVES